MKNYKYYDTEEFESLYNYTGNLGVSYLEEKSIFRIWSPIANKVILKLYGKEGYDLNLKYYKLYNMELKEKGIWEITIDGNLDGEYYNYIIEIDGEENEVVDPYAKAISVNGLRGMVVDFKKLNPKGWEEQKATIFESPTDSIIYEMHVRDFTIDENSGINKSIKGKFLGLVEEGTVFKDTNIKTGLDHLKELGINVVHLLPSFDYKTVDEALLNSREYNWGYDPLNYNALEGSYSTNPFLGEVRIREFKEMIMKFHKENIKVVMGVVYNHTSDSENSNFNLIVPNYYYRQDKEGKFSNGSGCGNETASERFMVRKFIVDSIKHFANEYKIDGFRFDLMGLHDIETIKEVRRELDKINKDILIYGEGWAGGDTPLKEDKSALKKNINKLGEMQIAAFSDDIRDAIKGRVFDPNKGGFINSIEGFEESLKFGIVGSIDHKDIDYSNIKYSESSWANEPYQVITYTSAHDNYTLWDKIYLADNKISEEDRILINKLAAAIIFTSQGIAFIHSGDEILRTKKEEDGTLVENSYKSSDYVNKFDWSRKEKYKDVFEYYKSLINLRKSHRVFKMKTSKEIKENIEFFKKGDNFKENNIVAYKIKGNNLKDSIGNIAVIFNGNKDEVEVKLDHDAFKVILDKDNILEEGLYNINSNVVKISRYSAMILKYE